jgi:hypothetical protein
VDGRRSAPPPAPAATASRRSDPGSAYQSLPPR